MDKTNVTVCYSEWTRVASIPSATQIGELIYNEEIRQVREDLLEEAGIPEMLCSTNPIISPSINESASVYQWSKLSKGANVIIFGPLNPQSDNSLAKRSKIYESAMSDNLMLADKLEKLSLKKSEVLFCFLN